MDGHVIAAMLGHEDERTTMHVASRFQRHCTRRESRFVIESRLRHAVLTSIPSRSMPRAVRHRSQPPERIGKDLVAASATPLLLAILHKGPSYGYAIIQAVRELSG